jgi:NADH-quinone oxidoreductase subunit L
MSEPFCYLWLIPTLPLLAAIVITFLGPRYLKQNSHWPCVLSIAGSSLLSFFVWAAVNNKNLPKDEKGDPIASYTYVSFIDVGADRPATDTPVVHAGVSMRADGLSAIMLVTVTFIGTLIAIFAVGYMKDDPGYPRFFAEVSLFVAAMTLLVAGDNLIMLFVGWEGVGLCSYLLIGFWFAKPSAAAAARKAFMVNRLGDFGFILGILLCWVGSGYHLDYETVFTQLPKDHPEWVTAACLLLFCGAMGKSAQVPLHVWLPDAMEGPTPVSALIHAATMVTAGVYMVARCTPLFSASPDAQLFVACIGGFTALFAALIALTQNDLKRIMAYSTLSQLGYMFLALGCAVKGEHSLVTFAVIAAIFHLFTHAFFKALLFLSSGSVMHAMGGVIDIRKFSGLRAVLPTTHLTFLCGALALAGFPVIASGFWSKDEILASAFSASHESAKYGGIYMLLFLAGVLTAGLTGFYTFRAYFRTFWGPLVVPPEAGSHGHGHATAKGHHAEEHKAPEVHESPPVMTIPLIILAFFAITVGAMVGPTHLFEQFVEKTPFFPELQHHAFNPMPMVASIVFALAGIALAYFVYVKKPETAGELAGKMPAAYQLSYNKFHVDELYDSLIVKRVQGFAEFCRILDQQVVDGLVDTIGEMPRLAGALFRPVQNGLVQFYALAMMLMMTVFLIVLARSL